MVAFKLRALAAWVRFSAFPRFSKRKEILILSLVLDVAEINRQRTA